MRRWQGGKVLREETERKHIYTLDVGIFDRSQPHYSDRNETRIEERARIERRIISFNESGRIRIAINSLLLRTSLFRSLEMESRPVVPNFSNHSHRRWLFRYDRRDIKRKTRKRQIFAKHGGEESGAQSCQNYVTSIST